MKKTFALVIVLLFLLTSCSQIDTSVNSDQNIVPYEEHVNSFSAKYYAKYSSSSGDRILNITYDVNEGEIIACQGTYTTAMTDGQTISNCELSLLLAQEYNVPLELVTQYALGNESYGMNQGRSQYNWEIINN